MIFCHFSSVDSDFGTRPALFSSATSTAHLPHYARYMSVLPGGGLVLYSAAPETRGVSAL